jgi:NADH dehydrogenase
MRRSIISYIRGLVNGKKWLVLEKKEYSLCHAASRKEKNRMPEKEIHAVTGAFGFSGKSIAQRLLNEGYRVVTLTNSVPRPTTPFSEKIEVHPLNFDRPDELLEALQGVSVLYNTYYVRFNYRGRVTFTYSGAVENSSKLFDAAKKAGVKRVVHISITNPSESSRFEYFRCKAIIERLLLESGLSYAILRPAVLFGPNGILINNIAWMLRKLPVFGVFGDGNYRLQPIYVDDLAALAVEQGKTTRNVILDAIGPQTFTYRELVEEIGRIIGKPRPIISIPPAIGFLGGYLIGAILHDRLITRDEIEGLMANLLYVDSPPAGKTRLTDWARENSAALGVHYESELARRKH